MDRTPQAYEPTYETHSEPVESAAVINRAFVKSRDGILKMCELIISCIVLICVAATSGWSYVSAGGWVNFVAAITLVFTALLFMFYLFNVIRRLRGPWVTIEFVALLVSTFFWFVAFIVSAANHHYGGGAIASAIFSFVATGLYIAELVTRFRVEKQGNALRVTATGVVVAGTTPAPYPHGGPATMPIVHSQPPPQEPRMGFGGGGGAPAPGYPHGELGDESYVMAS